MSGEEVVVTNTESKRETQERLSRLALCTTSEKRCLSYDLDKDKQAAIIFRKCPTCELEDICETCLSAGIVACRTCLADKELNEYRVMRNNTIEEKKEKKEKAIEILKSNIKVIIILLFLIYYNL